jgi:transposase
LFYGDESHICSEGYVPYGWQFPDEDVFIPVEKGYKINIWGLVSRDNRLHWASTVQNIDSAFVFEQLEKLSFEIRKKTVIVLDNASVHKAKIIQDHLHFWEQRGLYIFFLPPYSPELNIAETLWRKIKKEQIDPIDYTNKDTLFYATNQCLAQFGNIWSIKFSDF